MVTDGVCVREFWVVGACVRTWVRPGVVVGVCQIGDQPVLDYRLPC